MTGTINLIPGQGIGIFRPSAQVEQAPNAKEPQAAASFQVGGTATNLSNTLASIVSPSPSAGSQMPVEHAQKMVAAPTLGQIQ